MVSYAVPPGITVMLRGGATLSRPELGGEARARVRVRVRVSQGLVSGSGVSGVSKLGLGLGNVFSRKRIGLELRSPAVLQV